MATDDEDETDRDPGQRDTAAFPGPREPSRMRRAPLHERYRIIETLGKGGMGEVIAAHDEVLDRDVAIKRMLDVDHPGAMTRFLREAKIQGTLDHPAIPPVHELAHDADGCPFFVMKRVTGTTLAKILEDQQAGRGLRYPLERLLNAFADVCLAIELAHTRGVIHRDLKPANIMLGDFGEVFVLDWGVAKVVGQSDPTMRALRDSSPAIAATQAGVVVGTEGYLSPEQQQGIALDARADVYTLGCVLYEILTGKRFDANLPASRKTPERDIPPELEEACALATAPNRDLRLGSARELGARVQRYLDGDRDLAMRRRLASDHLALARATVGAATRDDDDAQRTAMREAGRALALDPTLSDAADLVGRLMLEPPRTIPAEVASTIADAERVSTVKHARTAGLAYLVYAAFIPTLAWVGIRDWTWVIAFSVIVGILLGTVWFRVRYPDHDAPVIVTIVCNAALIGALGRMFSPYWIAPGIAALTIVIIISSPPFRRTSRIVLAMAGMVIGTAGSGLLEYAGVLPATLTFSGDDVLINSGVLQIHELPVQVGLALYTVGLIVTAALVSRSLARVSDEAQRQLHLQAWRLRQLVPQA